MGELVFFFVSLGYCTGMGTHPTQETQFRQQGTTLQEPHLRVVKVTPLCERLRQLPRPLAHAIRRGGRTVTEDGSVNSKSISVFNSPFNPNPSNISSRNSASVIISISDARSRFKRTTSRCSDSTVRYCSGARHVGQFITRIPLSCRGILDRHSPSQ